MSERAALLAVPASWGEGKNLGERGAGPARRRSVGAGVNSAPSPSALAEGRMLGPAATRGVLGDGEAPCSGGRKDISFFCYVRPMIFV